jgi:hypothetical protein
VISVHIDEEALQSRLLRLRQAAFDADVAGVMKRTVNAVHSLFGYSGAAVMFIAEFGFLSAAVHYGIWILMKITGQPIGQPRSAEPIRLRST